MAKKAKTRKSITKRIKITGGNKMMRRNTQGKYRAKDSGVVGQEHRESKQIHKTDIRKIKDFLHY